MNSFGSLLLHRLFLEAGFSIIFTTDVVLFDNK